MPFEPGKSGNPAGKPKGAKNKSSEQIRETILSLISLNIEKVQRDFNKLSPKDRMKFFVDLLPFAVPKLSNTTMDLTFENLSDEQPDRMIEELKQDAIRQMQNNT